MPRPDLAAAALAAFLLASPAHAQPLARGVPVASHSADCVVETEAGRMPSRVWFSNGKERREARINGTTTVTITRPDKGVVWTVMPEQLQYVETPLADAARDAPGALPDYVVEQGPAGDEEVVNGVTCRRSFVTLTDRSSGATLEGYFWTTRDNIVVKADTASRDRRVRFLLDLTHLVVEEQPAALFELPSGFVRIMLAQPAQAPPRIPAWRPVPLPLPPQR